uniref:Secreted protein n=1 Tax=Heterorhabditis bacteriophora TaxID=37862 RepID=A0A1I7XC45_HETBA
MFSATYIAYCAVRRDNTVTLELYKNCFPKPTGGCKCSVRDGNNEKIEELNEDSECKKLIDAQTVENKKKLNAEITQKFGDFKDNCYPKPSGGCKCNVDLGNGEEVVEYALDALCKKRTEELTSEHKKNLNDEIKEKFGDFRENCFPKPSGGCKCNEKDAHGNEVVATYNNANQCKVQKTKRDRGTGVQYQPANVNQNLQKQQLRKDDLPSQNVRDPVSIYHKKGIISGCLCVIGKTAEGRDITERRMKDAECKCKEGEKGPGCPIA